MWSSLNNKRLTHQSFTVVVLLSIALTLLMPTWSYAVSEQISWIEKYKESGKTNVAKATATDKQGNVFVGGYDQGDGAFLRKYSAAGELLWKRSPGNKFGVIQGIAVADNDYIYVVGNYGLWGEDDIFVRKYGPNGGRIWTRHFGSKSWDYAGDIAVYKNYVYVVGRAYGALRRNAAKGQGDAFIRKYNTNARLYWTRQFGTAADDAATSVAVDSRGYIYVVGDTYSDPGQNSFIRKYSSQGRVRWARQLSGARATSVSVDSRRNIFMVGSKYKSEKGFAQKYSPGGKRLWRRVWGSSWPFAAAVDNRNNLYVFMGSVKSPSVASIRKYSRSGRRRWTRKTIKGFVNDAAVSVDNSLYVVGYKSSDNWFLVKY